VRIRDIHLNKALFPSQAHLDNKDFVSLLNRLNLDNIQHMYFVVYQTRPNSKNASLSFSGHMFGIYGGVIWKGFACAITAVPVFTRRLQPGVRMNIAVRWMLDNLCLTDEAVDWLKGVPHVWAHNYLIADKLGQLLVLSQSPTLDHVSRSVDFIHVTNHYLDEKLRKFEDSSFDFSNSHHRYNTIKHCMKRRTR